MIHQLTAIIKLVVELGMLLVTGLNLNNKNSYIKPLFNRGDFNEF